MEREFFENAERPATPVEKRQKEARERLAKAYKRLFKSGTADATLVYRDLIERCHIFHGTFRVESGKRQDFMEGERNIGLYLIAQCEMEDIGALKALEGGDAEAV